MAAEAVLKKVQEHPDAWTRVDAILEHSKNPQTKFFGLQVRAGCPAGLGKHSRGAVLQGADRVGRAGGGQQSLWRQAGGRAGGWVEKGRGSKGALDTNSAREAGHYWYATASGPPSGRRRPARGALAGIACTQLTARQHVQHSSAQPGPAYPCCPSKCFLSMAYTTPPCPSSPCQVLEAVIKTRWGALPDAQREGIKTYISNLIIKYSTGAEQGLGRPSREGMSSSGADFYMGTSGGGQAPHGHC
jgi:hypothetical protein